MSIFELAAILGALAWLPYLFKFIRDIITIPTIQIITQKTPEIGFTTFGPIFNIRVAFAVKNKDLVLSSIKIKLRHESGEEKYFSWEGIVQRLGELRNVTGEIIPMEKEQSVLAIKLNQKDIEERLIRFQEEEFNTKKSIWEAKVAKKLAYLQSKGKINYDELLESEEMKDLYSFIKQSFNWKPGKYTIEFEIESTEKFKLINNKYNFTLTALDIEALEKNKDLIEISYEDIFKMNLSDYKSHEVVWNWRYPKLEKST